MNTYLIIFNFSILWSRSYTTWISYGWCTCALVHTQSHTRLLALTTGCGDGRGQEDRGLVVDLSNKKSSVLSFCSWEIWSVQKQLSYPGAELRPDTGILTPSWLLFFSVTFHSNQFTPKVEGKTKQSKNLFLTFSNLGSTLLMVPEMSPLKISSCGEDRLLLYANTGRKCHRLLGVSSSLQCRASVWELWSECVVHILVQLFTSYSSISKHTYPDDPLRKNQEDPDLFSCVWKFLGAPVWLI